MGIVFTKTLKICNCFATLAIATLSTLAQGVAPTVTTPEASFTVHEKDHFHLSPVVTGDGPKSYQWSLNGTVLPNETNFAIFFRSIETTNAGTYSLVVSNAFGSTTATVASLDVQPFQHNKLIGWPGTVMSSDYLDVHYYLNFDDVEDVVDVSSGAQNNFAVLVNGSVLAWPNDYFIPPIALTNITTVAAGGPPINDQLAFGLTTDGSVIAWNQATNYILNISGVANLWTQPGFPGVLLLKSDGTLTTWDGVQFQPVTGLSNIIAATPASGGILALRNDGVVVASGLNLPNGLTNISAIAAADSAMFAVTAAGSLLQWNTNGYVTIPVNLTNVTAVCAYSESSIAALQVDGSVVAWGTNVAQAPPALTNAIAIRVGPADLAVVPIFKDTNQIEVTSQIYNENLLIGGSTTVYVQAQSSTPIHYQWTFQGTNITGATTSSLSLQNGQFADAGTYTLAMSNDFGATLTADVAVHVFPTNLYPVQLRTFGTPSCFVPPGLSNVVGFAATGANSIALKADGTIVEWGVFPQEYQTDFPNDYLPKDATNLVAVTAANHWGDDNCGLRKDGTVLNWGSPYERPYSLGGRRPPVGLKHVTAICEGGDIVLALKSDGKVVCWGNVVLDTSSLSNITKMTAGMWYQNLTAAAFLDKQGRPFVLGNFPPPPDGLSNLVDISIYPSEMDGGMSEPQGLALRPDGTTVCWATCDWTPPQDCVHVYPRSTVDRSGNFLYTDTSGTWLLATNVYAASFNPDVVAVLTSQLPIPTLTVSPSDSDIVVSWQSSSTWILESKTDLSQTAPWLPVQDGTLTYGDFSPGVSVDLPASPQRFFRLRLAQ